MTTARPCWTLSFLTLCDGVGLFCDWSEWIVVGQCSLRGDQLGTRNVIAYRLMAFVHHQKKREKRQPIKSHQTQQPISCLLSLTLLRDTRRLVCPVWSASKNPPKPKFAQQDPDLEMHACHNKLASCRGRGRGREGWLQI